MLSPRECPCPAGTDVLHPVGRGVDPGDAEHLDLISRLDLHNPEDPLLAIHDPGRPSHHGAAGAGPAVGSVRGTRGWLPGPLRRYRACRWRPAPTGERLRTAPPPQDTDSRATQKTSMGRRRIDPPLTPSRPSYGRHPGATRGRTALTGLEEPWSGGVRGWRTVWISRRHRRSCPPTTRSNSPREVQRRGETGCWLINLGMLSRAFCLSARSMIECHRIQRANGADEVVAHG